MNTNKIITSQRDLHANALINLLVNRYHNNLKDQARIIHNHSSSLLKKEGYLYPNLSRLVKHISIFLPDLLRQFKKEERFLFPNIIALAEKRLHEGSFDYGTYGIVLDYAAEMEKQHQYMLDCLQVFRELTGDYRIIEGDCRSYSMLMEKLSEFEVELTEHIHLESEVLIPDACLLKQS